MFLNMYVYIGGLGKEFVRTTQSGNLFLFRFAFVSYVRAGEAKLRERVRTMDLSTLGPRLGRCISFPARGCFIVFEFDDIFVGFKAFGL